MRAIGTTSQRRSSTPSLGWYRRLGVIPALLLAACSAAPSSVSRSASQPTPATASPTTQSSTSSTTQGSKSGRDRISTVDAVGASLAFAAGFGFAIRTQDGGRHWRHIYVGTDDIRQVDFLDARHGWLLGQSSLLRSAARGTWTHVGEPRRATLTEIQFDTPLQGFGLGYSDGGGPHLYLSTNGGDSWRVIRTPVAPVGFWAHQATLWLAGGTSLWLTHNGGRRWERVMSRVPLGPTGEGLEYGHAWIQPASPTSAWVEYELGQGAAGSMPWSLYFVKTSGWHTCIASNQTVCSSSPAIQSSYPPLLAAFGAEILLVAVCWACDPTAAGHGFLVAANGPPDPFGTVPFADPQAMDFGDRRYGYLVTPGSGLDVTSNGGRTWRPTALAYGFEA